MKKITYKLFPFLISFLFIFPIVKENISNIFIILLCINTIIYSISTKNYKSFNFKILYLTIPFWIILTRSIFSNSFLENFNDIKHSLFFLIFPILFSLIPIEFFSLKKINLYIIILKNICLLIVCIYIISFFKNVPIWKFEIVFQNVSVFREYIYNDFKLFVIHPTYFTTILILCSAHSYEIVLNRKKFNQFIYIISFFLINFFLLTRLNIVIQILVLLIMLFVNNSVSIKQKLIFLVSILSLITCLSFFTPGIKARFVELIESFSSKPKDLAYDSTNVRKAIYNCGLELAEENIVYGVGFSKLQKELNNCYKSNYNSSFYLKTDYLTHNYYLYILTSSGIFGLLFLFFYIFILIKIALKNNLTLFYVFLFNTFIICFVEDYFFRQHGCLYFNLLLMCFIQHFNYKENRKTTLLKED